jgi:hypothetical protein
MSRIVKTTTVAGATSEICDGMIGSEPLGGSASIIS